MLQIFPLHRYNIANVYFPQKTMKSSLPTDAEIRAALEKLDPEYDPAERLLRGRAYGLGYISMLKAGTPVHLTRESAGYATVLLMSGSAANIERAHDIYDRLLPLQCIDESMVACDRSTYGLWAHYAAERPQDQVPPDYNWADFIGVQLLNALLLAGESLRPGMKERIKVALHHAGYSILRRNCHPGYTNIAIMGTYVSITLGEVLQDTTLRDYGRERLRRLHAFTVGYGGYPEFNSPTYTIVAIQELARMLRDFTDEADLKLARELYNMAWRDVAVHWHVPTLEWAGPHKRSYQTLLIGYARDALQRSLGDDIRIKDGGAAPSIADIGVDAVCPDEWKPFFKETPEFRIVSQPASEGEKALRTTTLLTPRFTLGTAESWQTWKQQVPLVGYVNNDNGTAGSIRLRILHDGDFMAGGWTSPDLAGGWIRCAQDANHVLAATGFCIDGCHLARLTDAHLSATDLRVRIELANTSCTVADESLAKAWANGTARVRVGPETDLFVSLVDSKLEDFPVRLEVYSGITVPHGAPGQEGTTHSAVALDVVLYHGEKRMFKLDEIRNAYAVLALAMLGREDATPGAGGLRVTRGNDSGSVSWTTQTGEMRLVYPCRPLDEKQHAQWDADYILASRKPGREFSISG